jgi:hypothetical protein
MLSPESFDQKNGILGWDRDCYLSLIQFISSKNLRNYIGFSEETYVRIKHYHYFVYRSKFNKIPLRKLLLRPVYHRQSYSERTASSIKGWLNSFILEETIFERIFEIRLKYLANSISVKQINANDPWYGATGSGISYGQHGSHINYIFETCECYNVSLNSTFYHKPGENTMTVILDMRNGHDMMFFKINGITLKHVIVKISHNIKRILFSFGDTEKITILSLTHPVSLSIDPSKKYRYYKSINGAYQHIKNKIF